MAINTNFGEIRRSPAPLPEKIDGNVNCTRVYRHTCTWWSIQSDRGCDMGRSVLFSVTSEVEFPDNTNIFLSQMLQHYPLLTLLFVRLFPTSCFDDDFAVESLPRLFSTFFFLHSPTFRAIFENLLYFSQRSTYLASFQTPAISLPRKTIGPKINII